MSHKTHATANKFALSAQCLTFDCDAHVIPVCPTSKKPLIEEWQAKATSDPLQHAKWGRKWPHALIGVVMGPKSGLWAADIDYRNDGKEGFAALLAIHGALPKTAHYNTPGGERIVFKWPKDITIKNRVGDIAPGVDVKGAWHDGSKAGFIIVPPGVRADGGIYAWSSPSDGLHKAVDAPPWLLFSAIFNKRERARLAAIGITGPEGFAGVPMARWHTEYCARMCAAKPPRTATPLISAGKAQELECYVRSSVEKECTVLRKTDDGGRQTAIGVAALSIHGLLKGLEIEGVNSSELEEWAFERWSEAKDELGPGDHNAEDARDRWDRTYADANPRDLSHVRVRQQSDASEEFEPIGDLSTGASPTPKSPSKLITRWVDDQPLDAGIDWLVEELMPRQGTGFLVAKSGEGKTFLLVHLIMCLARGVPYFGREISTPGGSYLAAGEGSYSIPHRVSAALKHKFGQAGGAPLAYEASAPDLRSKDEFGAFLERVRAADADMQKRYGMPIRSVQFDTFQKCFGGKDENDASAIGAAIKRMQEIADTLKVAVLSTHHFGKNERQGARGSSAFRADVDLMLTVPTKGKLKLDKVRDAPDGATWSFSMPKVDLGTTAKGKPITSLYIVEGGPSDPDDEFEDISDATSEGVLIGCIKAAIQEEGKERAHPETGEMVLSVPLSAVRERFYAKWEGTADTKSKAFRRARAALESEMHLLTIDGQEYVGGLGQA